MASVAIAGGKLDRQIGHVQVFVYGDLRPCAGVAGVGPGILLPGVDSKFAGPRNRVENPEALAGAHVKAAHKTFHIGLAFGHVAVQHGGAHDDDVVRDGVWNADQSARSQGPCPDRRRF